MNRTIKVALSIVTFCLTAQLIKADGILLSWSARDVPGITEEAFDAARWNNWWANNKNNLKWNSEKGEFEGKSTP